MQLRPVQHGTIYKRRALVLKRKRKWCGQTLVELAKKLCKDLLAAERSVSSTGTFPRFNQQWSEAFVYPSSVAETPM